MVAQIQTVRPKTLKIALPVNPSQGIIQIFTAPDRTFYVDVIAQALRAAGQGSKVMVAQFFQGGIRQGVGLPRTLGQNLQWLRCNLSRQIQSESILTEAEAEAILDLWTSTKQAIASGTYGLMVLDELNLAIERSLLTEAEVIETLKLRPNKLEIIITGANIANSLISLADQVTHRRR
jgi:cob(I)alamin adenosyltransferase